MAPDEQQLLEEVVRKEMMSRYDLLSSKTCAPLSLSHTHTAHPSLHPHTHSHSLTQALTLTPCRAHTRTWSWLILPFPISTLLFVFLQLTLLWKKKNVSGESSQGPSWAKFELDRLQTFQSTSIDWHFDIFSNWTGCQKRGRPLLSQGGNFRNTCDNVDKLDCWFKLSKANN